MLVDGAWSVLISVVLTDTGVGVDTGVDTMRDLVSVSVSEHCGVGVGVGVGTLRCQKICWCRSTPAFFLLLLNIVLLPISYVVR